MTVTRQEHLDWCKQRALEYVNAGDLVNAVASMGSDLSKHPLTKFLAEPNITFAAALAAQSGDVDFVRRYITGFR